MIYVMTLVFSGTFFSAGTSSHQEFSSRERCEAQVNFIVKENEERRRRKAGLGLAIALCSPK